MNQHIVFDEESSDIPGILLPSICINSSLRKLQKNSIKIKLNFQGISAFHVPYLLLGIVGSCNDGGGGVRV